MFRTIAWMDRQHGAAMRALLSMLGFVSVFLLTARRALAREVASLFWKDQIKLAAHRLNWYLAHGWTGRLIRRTPRFDPTTGMDADTVNVLSGWLGKNSIRDRLARLYVLARQINETDDQTALLDEYTRVATTLVPELPVPGPVAKPVKAIFPLSDAKDALSALNVLPMRWYIISGTFLGAVREGTFLSHDYDIDIGIHAEEFDEAAFLNTVSQTPDLVLVNTSPYLHLEKTNGAWRGTPLPALYRMLHRSGIGIDLFIHHLDGDARWHGSAKHRWDNSEFSLVKTTIAGLTVLGPADADRYLRENYGDWRTPVTSFNCTTGTPNVRFPRNLTALVEHLHIAILSAGTAESEIAREFLIREGYVMDGGFSLPWR